MRAMLAVSTVSAGNAGDTIARIVLDQVSKQIGQSFLIENRTGAGRTIGSASVAIDPSATLAARSLTAMPAETGVRRLAAGQIDANDSEQTFVRSRRRQKTSTTRIC